MNLLLLVLRLFEFESWHQGIDSCVRSVYGSSSRIHLVRTPYMLTWFVTRLTSRVNEDDDDEEEEEDEEEEKVGTACCQCFFLLLNSTLQKSAKS